jgi:hypothetical protein
MSAPVNPADRRSTPRLPPSARAAVLIACIAVLLAGCGHGGGRLMDFKGSASSPMIEAGLPFIATKNTTRVAGANPIADAAAVAGAVFPSATPDTRPGAVALVDSHDWRGALAAAALMSPPLRAPLLLSDGAKLPAPSSAALAMLRPSGAASLGGAQLIRIGAVAPPGGLRATSIGGSDPYSTAAAIDALVSRARRTTGNRVIVASADAPGFALPAAAWAAKSGDPILYVTHDSVPPATRAAIARRPGARIYVLGPSSAVSDAVVTQLSGLGTVKRIGAADPISNAIAFARYIDGAFGWGIVNPGHGLIFASAERPLDAAAAAPLSASGTYGPLLLVDDPLHLAPLLSQYLLDIQPGYADDPVRGVYNHGWLIGDQNAISSVVQSRIDALLEISASSPAKTTP